MKCTSNAVKTTNRGCLDLAGKELTPTETYQDVDIRPNYTLGWGGTSQFKSGI